MGAASLISQEDSAAGRARQRGRNSARGRQKQILAQKSPATDGPAPIEGDRSVGDFEMRKSLWMALGALALASGAALPAAATVSLDQATVAETGTATPSGFFVFLFNGERAYEQTFTVGKAGVLDHIAIALVNSPELDGNGDITAELFNTPFDFTTGAPSPLASAVIPFASLPETLFPDLAGLAVFNVSAAHLHVNVGDTFTFSVRGGDGAVALTGSPYAGGGVTGSQFWAGHEVYAAGDGTLGFRTYVASVPEPAAWALMLVGFAGLGGAMRRRRAGVAAA
jgi:hypothetical protein